jgi:mono/diheme cytochrome c family protein
LNPADRRGVAALIVLGAILLALCSGCDYARMRDDEAVNTYQIQFPQMPDGAVPEGAGPDSLPFEEQGLKNPLESSKAAITAGAQAYQYFCIQCHGPRADGFGTVGQSFAPLPTNLRSDYVQQQPDGQLFFRIGQGYKRHPPLAYTVSVPDRWALIAYIRSIAN